MIRIRELRRVKEEEDVKVHISYFAQVEDQSIYQEVVVNDFDIENSTVEQIEAMVEANADEETIMGIFKDRKKQLSNTYKHDGQSFRRDAVLKEWEFGGVYEVDDVVEFEGKLYRCVQAHTAVDATWTPVATAALWSSILVFADEYRPWKQPQGAHDAYPLGAIVRHTGQLWMSDHAANVWEPPTEWVAYDPNPKPEPDPETPPADDPDNPEAWIQPVGAHDAYPLGARVAHNGKIWESNHAANVWEPPTQWTEVV